VPNDPEEECVPHRVLVLVPFAFDEEGLANRRAQLDACELGPNIEFHFEPVKAGPALYDSHHDWMLADVAMFEAGMHAERNGYEAVCIDTMSDSGVNALRSLLDIPVIGPGRASYLMALNLGKRFGVLTQWDPWKGIYERGLQEAGLADKCVSIRSVNIPPDVKNLLGGKEEVVFPRLVEEGMRCIEDGAEVICLGSTTMHQAHSHLEQNLPVPVINPGPLTYKLAETLIGLRLSQSKKAFPKPNAGAAPPAEHEVNTRGPRSNLGPSWFFVRSELRRPSTPASATNDPVFMPFRTHAHDAPLRGCATVTARPRRPAARTRTAQEAERPSRRRTTKPGGSFRLLRCRESESSSQRSTRQRRAPRRLHGDARGEGRARTPPRVEPPLRGRRTRQR
jgi:allantoin racemase